MTTRPDILLILADQWGAAQLNSYGLALPGVTPHLDALAASGVRFARCYTPSPACCPARASILTGRSPAIHGVLSNNLELTGDVDCLPEILRGAGYRTAGVGKFHHTAMPLPVPDSLDQLGYDEVEVTEDPKWGPWLDWIRREHPAHAEAALAVCWEREYAAHYGAGREDLAGAWHTAVERHLAPLCRPPFHPLYHPSPLPAELHQSTWITDRAIGRLEREADAQPLFLAVSYVDPHDPYDPPRPYDTMFPPAAVPPPVPQAWDPAVDAQVYARFARSSGIAGFTAADWARMRGLFFGSCRFVDDQIGRLLAAVQRRARPTLIVFATDHGDLMGDHGLYTKGPWHFDACIRVPLIVAGPGVEPGLVHHGLASLLDILPTCAAAAGVPAGHLLVEGRALPLTAAAMAADPGPHELAIESNVSRAVQARTLVADDGWRLTLFPDDPGRGELYDLRADPGEQRNRFHDPACRDRRLQLGERLIAAQARQFLPPPRRNRHPQVVYGGFDCEHLRLHGEANVAKDVP